MSRVLVLGLILLPGVARSQDGQVAVVASLAIAKEDFDETFDNAVPVAGSPLVGLAIGRREGRLDATGVLLPNPSDDEKAVCVQSTTQDGRFAASNPYRVGHSAKSVIRLAPITIVHGQDLASYDQSQFAVRAFVPRGNGCSAARALHLPELREGDDAADDLLVMANGKSRGGVAQLQSQTSQHVISTRCQPPQSGARISYDLICDLKISELPKGEATLTLEFDDGFATESFSYAVFLPARAGGG